MSCESLWTLSTRCVYSFSSLKSHTPPLTQPPNPAIHQILSTLSSEYLSSQSPANPKVFSLSLPSLSLAYTIAIDPYYLFIFLPSVSHHSNKMIAFLQQHFKKYSLLDLEQILDHGTEGQWHSLWALPDSRTSSATSFSLMQPHSWAQQFVIPYFERISCFGYPWICCLFPLSVPSLLLSFPS